MQVAPDAPKRPALRYFGGKWRLAPWIISHFPPHEAYVEPCGGAASVLLQKPCSPLETYNDLDSNVVNFFRVLRDKPDELLSSIEFTPWSRQEFELAVMEPQVENDIESARRFYIRSWFSMHGGTDPVPSDWRRRHEGQSPALEIRQIDHIQAIAKRLSLVQIEHDTAIRIIAAYQGPNTLIYFDPPYIQETRTRHRGYMVEPGDFWHIEAADLLHQCQGYAVVSGYACPLYAELYESHGWQRFDKETQTNSGGKQIESLWLSPRTIDALDMPRQAEMKL